jgi:hypothetical protein
MNRLIRRLWALTIWHPDAIPAQEGQASHELKRYVLPLFDVLVIIMGVNAVRYGILATVAAWVLLGSGVIALVGISFPHLWIAEALGKIAMVSLLGAYAGALWVLLFQGEWTRGFVAAGLTAIIVLPMWNLARLGRERQGRRTTRTGGR